jgi:hypothetical protein
MDDASTVMGEDDGVSDRGIRDQLAVQGRNPTTRNGRPDRAIFPLRERRAAGELAYGHRVVRVTRSLSTDRRF